MFGRKTAQKLDNAAALYDAGEKVAGKAGGRAGNAIANAVLGPIRRQIDESCTNCNRGKCKKH
ncbi:hypothetical protein ACFU8I_02935 [Streptomyces sp. NPDC057540]|uniref:hypothetical protein n=1 Tax=Streptomyces sp. NPDC057540 TaxID=3346160 RepID=UPI0036C3A4DC